jgi:hypothetical protein
MIISQTAVNAIIDANTIYDDMDQPRWLSWDGVFEAFLDMTGSSDMAHNMVEYYLSFGDKPEWLDQVA